MILDDANERTALKGSRPSSIRDLERGLQSMLPSPPPYFSYDAIPPPAAAAKPTRRKHRSRRKWLIFSSALFNCLVVALFLQGFLLFKSGHDHVPDSNSSYPPPERESTRRIRPVVPASNLGRCVQQAIWSNSLPSDPEDEGFPFISDTAFELPTSSLLFLISQGALSGGTVTVLPSSNSTSHVHLYARYHSLEVRDRANVCLMERKHANGAGIGIFTPLPFDNQTEHDRLDFSITVYLASLNSPEIGVPLPIHNLETHLPSFAHTLGHLKGLLEFDRLVLRSSNQPIIVESLVAANATVQTSNSPISGKFEASLFLSLVTSNSPIDVSVNLHHKHLFSTTELVLQTRNGQLESVINLISAAADGQGGKYSVTALTSDAPLVMTFPVSPTHSILNLDAKTSNSPANVWLNHAYEGAFTLLSSMVVVERRPFLDPTRLRSVFYDYKNGMIVGSVIWKQPIFRRKVLGSVHVTTSNDLLKLHV